ncbi:MAG: nucleotidyltransferase domain-containing protein [Candidatus Eremiobacteraeota bacterium]|nr:nucleotidyltransferase domain-containing protein [Candidatus Eremiobacteraeota bacterium]
MTELEWELAREYRRRLQACLGDRLKAVRVFGSRARGDSHPESDLDVFVLIDSSDRPTRYEIIDAATDLCLETHYAVDISPLIMDELQYQNLIDHERRIVRDIQLEGIAID